MGKPALVLAVHYCPHSFSLACQAFIGFLHSKLVCSGGEMSYMAYVSPLLGRGSFLFSDPLSTDLCVVP